MKVYIAGKIAGNENYQEDFKKVQERFEKGGHIVLNPALLPQGMESSDYMKICFAMIDVADTVFFIKGWENSKGANLELNYCLYCGKETSESWRKQYYDQIKENTETINELVIRPMYENGEFCLNLADAITEAIYKRVPEKLIDDGAFGRCQCGYEFNSELADEYHVKFCLNCGQAVDTMLEGKNDKD